MAQTWYKTDTAADNSGNKCYTDTVATNPFYIECAKTDPSPSGSDTVTMPAKADYMIGAFESVGGMGVTSIPAGTWTININVTGAAGSGAQIRRLHICEITPAGTPVKTIASTTALVVDIATTGNKALQVTLGSPVSVTSTNHFYIQIGAYCNTHSGTSVTIDRTLTIVDTIVVVTAIECNNKGTINTASFNPTLKTDTTFIVNSAGAATVVGYNPTVGATTTIAQIAAGAVSVNSLNVDINAEVIVGAGVGTTTVTGYDVLLPIKVEVALGAVTVIGYDPTVDAGTGVTEVDCTFGAITIAKYVADIDIDVDIDCTLGAVTVAGHNPTIGVHQLRQQSYRWRYADGDEATAAWRAAADTSPAGSVYPQVPYRLRFLIQEYGGAGGPANQTFNLYYRRNAGTWTLANDQYAEGGWANGITNGADTTQQLGVGSFIANNDGQCADSQLTMPSAIAAGKEFELEYSFYISQNVINNGDTFEFRVEHSGGGDLDSYAQTPSITITKPAYTRWTVQGWRIRKDDGDEAGASWWRDAEEVYYPAEDTTFRIRFLWKERYGEDYWEHPGSGIQWTWKKNGVGGSPIWVNSNDIHLVPSQLVNDADTTQQLGSGSFCTDNNAQIESTTYPKWPTHTASQEFEYEYSVEIVDADTSPGDYIDFGFGVPCTDTDNPWEPTYIVALPRLYVGRIAADVGATTVAGYDPTVVWDTGTEVDCTIGAVTVAGYNATVGVHELTQASFRWRYDNGNETTAAWRAAADTDPASIYPEVVYRLRFLIQETGGAAGSSGESFALFYRRNAGAWEEALYSTNRVWTTESQLVELADTTQQLGVGTFLANNDGQIGQEDYWVLPTALPGNNETEVEVAFYVRWTQCTNGDTFEFRLEKDDGTDLTAYTNTPSVTINRPAYQRWSITDWRWRNDDGTEVTATWAALAEQQIQIEFDTLYRLRFLIKENYGELYAPEQGSGAGLRYSVDEVGSVYVTTLTTDIKYDTSSQLVNGLDTLQRLGSGDFQVDNDGQRDATNYPGVKRPLDPSYETEHEYALIVPSAGALVQGNSINLKWAWGLRWRNDIIPDTPIIFVIEGVITQIGAVTVAGYNPTVDIVAAATEVDVTLGTVSIAKQTPVDININAQVGCTLKTVTVAGYGPTIKADTQIDVTAGAVTVVGYGPTIVAATSIDVTLGTVTIAGYGTSLGVNVNATFGAVTVTGYAPTVKVDENVIATIGAVTVASFNPTVEAGQDVQCILGAVTVAGYAPTIKFDEKIVATLETITVAGYITDININAQVEATIGAVTIAGYNATVKADTSLVATFDTISIAGYITDININAQVGATLGTIAVADYNPTIKFNEKIVATLGAATIAGYNTIIQTGQEISTTLGAVTVIGYNSILKTDVGFTTTFDTISIAGFDPTVTIDVDIGVALGAVTVASYNTTVTISAQIDCTLGTASIAGYAADVKADTAIDAAAGAITVAGFNASIVAGQDIVATLGAVTVTGYNPTVISAVEIVATLGIISATGANVTVNSRTQVDATLRTVTVAGYDTTIKIDAKIDVTLGIVNIAGYSSTIGAAADIPVTVGATTITGYDTQVGILTDVAATGGAVVVNALDTDITLPVSVIFGRGRVRIVGYTTDILGGAPVPILDPSIGVLPTHDQLFSGGSMGALVTHDALMTMGTIGILSKHDTLMQGGTVEDY